MRRRYFQRVELVEQPHLTRGLFGIFLPAFSALAEGIARDDNTRVFLLIALILRFYYFFVSIYFPVIDLTRLLSGISPGEPLISYLRENVSRARDLLDCKLNPESHRNNGIAPFELRYRCATRADLQLANK